MKEIFSGCIKMVFGLFSVGFIFKMVLLIMVIAFDYMIFQNNPGIAFLVIFMELMVYLQLRNRGFGLLRSGTGTNGSFGRNNINNPQNETQGLEIMLRLMELEAQNRNNMNLIKNQQLHGENTAEKKPVYLSEEHRLMRKIFETN